MKRPRLTLARMGNALAGTDPLVLWKEPPPRTGGFSPWQVRLQGSRFPTLPYKTALGLASNLGSLLTLSIPESTRTPIRGTAASSLLL